MMDARLLFLEQNERYLHLAGKLVETKEQASSSKQDKDKHGQKVAQEKIRRIQQGQNIQHSHHNVAGHCITPLSQLMLYSKTTNV